MTRPQVGVDIRPCGACGEYIWMSEKCPHSGKFNKPVPRGGQLKYDYPPGLDAKGRRLFRQRIHAREKRASLTSGG